MPTPVTKTWTLDADFDEGTLLNVNHTVVADQLQRDTSGAVDFALVAYQNRSNNTVAIVADDGATTPYIAAIYKCHPADVFMSPERVSWAPDGTLWIGTATTAVVRVGVVIGGTRCDSDGTTNAAGLWRKAPFTVNTTGKAGPLRSWIPGVDSASGLAWPAGTDSAGGTTAEVQDADDDAILVFQRTTGLLVTSRAVAALPTNGCVVTSQLTQAHNSDDTDGGPTFWLELTAQGQIIGAFSSVRCAWWITHVAGRIWGSSWTSGTPAVPAITYPLLSPWTFSEVTLGSAASVNVKGFCVDGANGVFWYAEVSTAPYFGVRMRNTSAPATPVASLVSSVAYNSTPVAAMCVDPTFTKRCWMAKNAATSLFRVSYDGSAVLVAVQFILDGVAGTGGLRFDHRGKLWAQRGTGKLQRWNPATMVASPTVNTPETDLQVGSITVDDNSGEKIGGDFVASIVGAGGGGGEATWRVIYTAAHNYTVWTLISWHETVVANTTLRVEWRAAGTLAQLDLTAWTLALATTGPGDTNQLQQVSMNEDRGQYLEVRVSFERPAEETGTPILYDLTVTGRTVDAHAAGYIPSAGIEPLDPVSPNEGGQPSRARARASEGTKAGAAGGEPRRSQAVQGEGSKASATGGEATRSSAG